MSSPPSTGLQRRGAASTLLCFSHLRWNFVYQRPQHLMTRLAREYSVSYMEEPVFDAAGACWLEVRDENDGVQVLVPHLASHQDGVNAEAQQRDLLDRYLAGRESTPLLTWYYTPISLAFSKHLSPDLMVYDCMDELSAFRGAPAELVEWERELLARADVVFTGGYSLYEAKRYLHPNVHAFPSSVDVSHFAKARKPLPTPDDQRDIPRPRLGFYGVLDERLDTALLREAARQRPDWHFVLVGPVVKIDPDTLPQGPNIHYLGGKRYEELPAYLSGWDVALMPFAMNESTRYISPTKTPEYLAGGRCVVSTPIADVVRTYGASGLVRIASSSSEFVTAIERTLAECTERDWLHRKADALLHDMSWDTTSREMRARMEDTLKDIEQSTPREADSPAACVSTTGRPAARSLAEHYDAVVVGAGFAGSVMAERLATQLGHNVLVIDRRPHIGGNAYDCFDADGIRIHRYGPHIFHTNSQKVVAYLSRFTRWRAYEHRVLASVGDKLVPIPINRTTLSILNGRSFSPEEAAAFLKERAETIEEIRTSEDVVLSTVGRELYETFFRGYTRKQWGLDPSELDKSVTARVPTRTSFDDRYFTDSFQSMPADGYTAMFENMLDHPNITVSTGTDYRELGNAVRYDRLVYCGPIDEFFDYRFGPLPYRSLAFRHETLDQARFQPTAVVNYPSETVPYTRITEYKHLTGQRHPKTSITYEYPSAEGDPYYPVPRPENHEVFRQYQELADQLPNVTFVGRLATYRYYNMDQVVAQALTAFERIAQASPRLRDTPALLAARTVSPGAKRMAG